MKKLALPVSLFLLLGQFAWASASHKGTADPKGVDLRQRSRNFQFQDAEILFSELQPPNDENPSVRSDCWPGANFASAGHRQRLGLRKIFVSDRSLLGERWSWPLREILQEGALKWVCSGASFSLVDPLILLPPGTHSASVAAGFAVETEANGALDARALLVVVKNSDRLFGLVLEHPFHSQSCVKAYRKAVAHNPDEERLERSHERYLKCLAEQIKKDPRTLRTLRQKVREALTLASERR